MSEERERNRCRSCELVQWNDRTNCRLCGASLPGPIVKIVERVVERAVVRQDPQCLEDLERARELIAAASRRLSEQALEHVTPLDLAQISAQGSFPTLAEVEQTMIVAAYNRANRKSVEAARLLGLGKTTFYRKLRELGKCAV